MYMKGNQTLALIALAITAFAIGTTEFISVGLLPLIADDFQSSVQAAGLTVSLYAVGVVVGAPILTPMLSQIPKKKQLLLVMLVFIVGNSIAAVAPNMFILLIARFISALAHGVFMSIGSTIAASLVHPSKRAGAISIMFTGLTVATITGVPFGTFIGQQFDWRLAFLFIVAIGLLASIANLILLPNTLPKGVKVSLKDQGSLLRTVPILLVLIITALGYGGTFVVFTYLSPLLQQISGFSPETVTWLLLVYGIAVAVGNIAGGKLANRRPVHALFFMFLIQAVILAALYVTLPVKWLGLVFLLLMGLFAFMNVPGLQSYIVVLAERLVPKAIDIASAWNIAAFNAGIALGSYLGGIITERLGLIHTSWLAALMVAAAVGLTAIARKLEDKGEIHHEISNAQ
jgi:predicted MFS family arabinose efflux permease